MDKRVMGAVFAVHNEFGRLLDEELYKGAIAGRCTESGIAPIEKEVRIRLTHESFRKDYYMDLVFAHGMMVEVKTAEAISPAHRAQALNYLLMAGLRHGKLLNLRPPSVEWEFVSTTLDAAQRRRFCIVDDEWRELDVASGTFRRKLIELLEDWGAFLEISPYREAMNHLLNGPNAEPGEVELWDGVRLLGRQKIGLVIGDTAFRLTAVTKSIEQMAQHQRRFLAHTRLPFLQWVNLNHARIEFRTLSR